MLSWGEKNQKQRKKRHRLFGEYHFMENEKQRTWDLDMNKKEGNEIMTLHWI